MTNIEKLFPNITPVDEAKSLVQSKTASKLNHWHKFENKLKKQGNTPTQIAQIIELLKYPENPLVEKLNMLLFYRGREPEEIHKMYIEYLNNKNPQYSDLYQKNSFNLLFQLYNDYRTPKVYSGIDTFIHLSSGVIRYAIELCNQSLKTARNYDYNIEDGQPIANNFQNMASKYLSDTSFSDIRSIAGNMGLGVQSFVNEIGTIFRTLHLNLDLVEPEPTHFETRYSELNDNSKFLIDTALQHGILQEKPPMEPKNVNETKGNDYILNRIFAPKFEISYRVRGRTYIDPVDLQELISANENKRNEIRKLIVKNNSKSFTQFDTRSDAIRNQVSDVMTLPPKKSTNRKQMTIYAFTEEK